MARSRCRRVVISGDADKTVSTNIHSRPFAAAVPNAKLIVLPGVGHMVQNAAPDLVIATRSTPCSAIGHGVSAMRAGAEIQRGSAAVRDINKTNSRDERATAICGCTSVLGERGERLLRLDLPSLSNCET